MYVDPGYTNWAVNLVPRGKKSMKPPCKTILI